MRSACGRNHQAHALLRAQAERLRRLLLTSGDALDARTDNLGDKRPGVDHQADQQRCVLRRHLEATRRS